MRQGEGFEDTHGTNLFDNFLVLCRLDKERTSKSHRIDRNSGIFYTFEGSRDEEHPFPRDEEIVTKRCNNVVLAILWLCSSDHIQINV